MLELFFTGFDIEVVVGNIFSLILLFIVFDVITGILASAKERKLNSSISFEGLIYKIGELIALMFFTFIDVYFKADGNIINIGVGLIVIYEGMSIIENFSRIGLDVKFLTKWFDENKVGGRE